jgi:hypothetical protein
LLWTNDKNIINILTKTSPMKISFKLFILFLSLQTMAVAQDSEPCALSPDIQSFPLIENKITFHSAQMDLTSVAVELCGDTEEELILPKILISEDETSVVIDFDGSNIGTYIITGTRGSLPLTYAIEKK